MVFLLQGSKYADFDDFHADMMLVKENCCLYNPEQSAVRKDCDEVFSFYQQEYDKLMDKWQKVGINMEYMYMIERSLLQIVCSVWSRLTNFFYLGTSSKVVCIP